MGTNGHAESMDTATPCVRHWYPTSEIHCRTPVRAVGNAVHSYRFGETDDEVATDPLPLRELDGSAGIRIQVESELEDVFKPILIRVGIRATDERIGNLRRGEIGGLPNGIGRQTSSPNDLVHPAGKLGAETPSKFSKSVY